MKREEALRSALADHPREIEDPHRAYDVTFQGVTTTVIATGAGQARYSRWLDCSEVDDDLSFRDFLSGCRVVCQARQERPAP